MRNRILNVLLFVEEEKTEKSAFFQQQEMENRQLNSSWNNFVAKDQKKSSLVDLLKCLLFNIVN